MSERKLKNLPPWLPTKLEKKMSLLRKLLLSMDNALIAFSGGVDSTFLLKVASETVKNRVLAVTAYSEIHPSDDLKEAREFAESLGVKHLAIKTNELDDFEFTSNPSDRCYHCKSRLYMRLSEIGDERGIKNILDGANADDKNDYRPGARATREFGVLSPLQEAGLTKPEIREMSQEMNLPTWDKPASPCLASRIPYGITITEDKLRRVEKAESYLRSLGIKNLRVRDHDQIARIEVPAESMEIFAEEKKRAEIVDKLKSFGFPYITLDLEGFRSGSLNEILDRQDE